MIVEFINVSKYSNQKKKKYSVKDASFLLNEQQSLAVLGKNESGASDLLKLISGSVLPNKGKILRSRSLSIHIGDATTFHRELTGEENIRFLCKLYGTPSKLVIPEVASLTGLGETLKKRVKSYTPPQRRKIALSLPLFLDIKMYIVDSGIGHPDVQFAERYKKLFTQKMFDKTLIIRSSDPTFLKQHTSAAVIVKDGGKVIFTDTLEEGLEKSNKVNAG